MSLWVESVNSRIYFFTKYTYPHKEILALLRLFMVEFHDTIYSNYSGRQFKEILIFGRICRTKQAVILNYDQGKRLISVLT